MHHAPRLLWLDAGAAATAGALTLAVSSWLSALYRLPLALVVFIAVVNLLYGAYSFSLTQRRNRPAPWIQTLVAANLAWVGACLAMAWRYAGEASAFGLLHLIAEAVFVGGLALCEWRWRHRLAHTLPAATARKP
jgi:hypothetical protein